MELIDNKEEQKINEVINLKDYLDENKDLLMILGVFVAITALSANLSIKLIAAFISFMSFTCCTFILIEIWKKSIKKGRRTSMLVGYFKVALFLLALGFFLYWFIIMDVIYPGQIIFMLLSILIMELFALFLKKLLNTNNFINKVKTRIKNKKLFKSIVVVIVAIIIILSLGISRFISNKISLPIYRLSTQIILASSEIKGSVQ